MDNFMREMGELDRATEIVLTMQGHHYKSPLMLNIAALRNNLVGGFFLAVICMLTSMAAYTLIKDFKKEY